MNTLLVALVNLVVWMPAAIVHFVSVKGVADPTSEGFKQAAGLLGAMSGLLGVGVRLMYRPIWTAVMFKPQSRMESILNLQE